MSEEKIERIMSTCNERGGPRKPQNTRVSTNYGQQSHLPGHRAHVKKGPRVWIGFHDKWTIDVGLSCEQFL